MFTIILAQPLKAARGFVIIIDPKSHAEARAEVEAYARAIEEVNKLKVYTVDDRWGVPDSIRACLYKMYSKGAIEGAVFVGDIPVPMIRDAQHLTSAFKMDQKMEKSQSSVPSDRFYDDFGLKFRYLEKTDSTGLFYYSLRADGDQYVHCDIYTGRIRPTDAGGTNRYDKLRRFLRKAVAEKRSQNRLDRVFFFTGQGSLSESRVAAMDEKQQYYEHFPWLKNNVGETVKYIDYAQEKYIKPTLMNELMREDLDLSVLHHHGDPDTQYLGKANKDVPDSIDESMRDLHLPDFAHYGFKPNSRFVIFDACYNGAFQNPDCIANEYVFSDGKTVACMAGTVNILQDKWYDRFLGLLGFGRTVGEINNAQELLESHIIGDPTLVFACETSVKENATPDGKAFRLAQDFEKGKVSAARLLETLRTSPYAQVRMQALQLLARKGGKEFTDALAVAAFDRHEMTQRFAINYIKFNGSSELALPLFRVWVDNSVSARVQTDARMAVEFFPKDVMKKAYNEVWPTINYVNKDSLGTKYYNVIDKYSNYWEKEVDEIIADTLKDKKFAFSASCMRLYCPHARIPDMMRFIQSSRNDARRLQLLEAMGWYRYSWQAPVIARIAKEISENPSESEEMRQEALKTYNRITWNGHK